MNEKPLGEITNLMAGALLILILPWGDIWRMRIEKNTVAAMGRSAPPCSTQSKRRILPRKCRLLLSISRFLGPLNLIGSHILSKYSV